MAKELTLKELQDQIFALQLQADLIIQVEKSGVIEEIKAKISQYGITFNELGFKAPEPLIIAHVAPEKEKNTGKGKSSTVAVYFNKENHEETWKGGKGALPTWLKTLADKHLSDKKMENKAGNMIVPNADLKKWLDDNGYKIPMPVAPVAPAVPEVKAVAK